MNRRTLIRVLLLPLAAYLLAVSLLWYFTGPQPKVVLRAEEKLSPVAFTPDCRYLVTRPVPSGLWSDSYSTGPIRFWDVTTGQEHGRVLEEAHDIEAVELSPDGRRLAVTQADRVTVIECATGVELNSWPFVRQPGHYRTIRWSPDGTLITLVQRLRKSDQETIQVFDVVGGQERMSVKAGIVCAVSPDGRFLATADSTSAFKRRPKSPSQIVRLWDLYTGQELRSFRIENEFGMLALEFSPDGTLLMADNSKTVVWEVATGETLWEQSLEKGDIRSAKFLPAGEGIASVDCRFNSRPNGFMEIALTVRDPRSGKPMAEKKLGTAWAGAQFQPSPNSRWAGVEYVRYGIPVGMDDALRATGLPTPWLNQHLHSSWRVFDLASGEELLTVRNSQLVFSSGTLVATTNSTPAHAGEGAVRIYELPAPKPIGLILGWALVGPVGIVTLQLTWFMVGQGLGWLGRRGTLRASGTRV